MIISDYLCAVEFEGEEGCIVVELLVRTCQSYDEI
jgi:hypothetical protein